MVRYWLFSLFLVEKSNFFTGLISIVAGAAVFFSALALTMSAADQQFYAGLNNITFLISGFLFWSYLSSSLIKESHSLWRARRILLMKNFGIVPAIMSYSLYSISVFVIFFLFLVVTYFYVESSTALLIENPLICFVNTLASLANLFFFVAIFKILFSLMRVIINFSKIFARIFVVVMLFFSPVFRPVDNSLMGINFTFVNPFALALDGFRAGISGGASIHLGNLIWFFILASIFFTLNAVLIKKRSVILEVLSFYTSKIEDDA